MNSQPEPSKAFSGGHDVFVIVGKPNQSEFEPTVVSAAACFSITPNPSCADQMILLLLDRFINQASEELRAIMMAIP